MRQSEVGVRTLRSAAHAFPPGSHTPSPQHRPPSLSTTASRRSINAARQKPKQLSPPNHSEYACLRTSADAKINLLPLIQVRWDTVSGTWNIVSGALVSQAGEAALIAIPFDALPREYDLQIEVERKKGMDTFAIGLVVGAAQFVATIDSNTIGGRLSGLEFLATTPSGSCRSHPDHSSEFAAIRGFG